MKWLTKTIAVVKVGLVALRWFEAAKADGVITLSEMQDGVTQLLEAAGLDDDIEILVDG